jgi:glucokinase
LGLDIGGTKLAVAVVTPDGETHGFQVQPTRRDEGHEVILGRLFDMGRESIALAGLGPIVGVGISCGGPLDAKAGVLTAPLHLPGWDSVPIVRMAQEQFSVPVVLENDASAAALGEYRYGAARGAASALYLTISTGIGGGAVLAGSMYGGAAGNGGEYGHIMVRPGGRLCACGRHGCLEAYASGSSIAERAREAIAGGAPSSLSSLEVVRAEDVSAAAVAGDSLAQQLWAETTDVLGQAITDLVNVWEPGVVVLGGGVTRSGPQLIDPIRETVRRDAMPPAAASVRIELAELGDAVGVVGAACGALDIAEETAEGVQDA